MFQWKHFFKNPVFLYPRHVHYSSIIPSSLYLNSDLLPGCCLPSRWGREQEAGFSDLWSNSWPCFLTHSVPRVDILQVTFARITMGLSVFELCSLLWKCRTWWKYKHVVEIRYTNEMQISLFKHKNRVPTPLSKQFDLESVLGFLNSWLLQ